MTTNTDKQFEEIVSNLTTQKWSRENEIRMRNNETTPAHHHPTYTPKDKLEAIRQQLGEDESKRYGINAAGELRLPERGAGRSSELGYIEYNDLKTHGDGITCVGTQCGRYIGELHEGDHYFCECGINMLKYSEHGPVVLEIWQSHRARTTPLDMTPKRLAFVPRSKELQRAYNKLKEQEQIKTSREPYRSVEPATRHDNPRRKPTRLGDDPCGIHGSGTCCRD